MDLLNENIRFLRKQKNLTQQEFADELGIKRANVGAYEEGRAKPNIEVQMKVAQLFNLSLDQLITKNLAKLAEKNLFKETQAEKDIAGKGLRVLSITVDSDNRENIEMVSQKAAAGYLNGYADPVFVEELPKFRLPFLPVGTYRAFEITGDSMLPLQPGSIVVGEYVDDWHDIKDGHTYVVVSQSDGVVYKRVFNQIEEGRKLVLRSDNASYEPFEVEINDVLEIWKARMFISYANPVQENSMDKLMSMITELQQEVVKLKEDK